MANTVYISPSGYVGISTSSPTAQLHICLDTVTFPAKNVARIVNLGYSGITGAQNWTLRGAFQYSGGIAVNADGGDLDLIKSLDRNTILATKTDGTALGNVGIGTTGPISRLNVYASGSNLSVLKVDGGNGTLFEVTDNLSGSLFSVNTIAGLPVLEVFSNNRVVAGKYAANDFVISGSRVGIGIATPSYKLQVSGSFGATTKSFIINHPTKPNKYLVHGSLEGPENGVYVRGYTNSNIIELPEYWSGLVHEDTITVQLTAKGRNVRGKIRNYAVDSVNIDYIRLITDSEDDVYDLYYYVQAERKDVAKLTVETDKN